MKRKGPKSLNERLITFMILCWFVPITILFASMTISYQQGIIKKSERLMEDELENVAAFASIRIEDAITLSQRPSYERTWESAWRNFQDKKSTKNDYLQTVFTSLRGKFYVDERFNMYAYYCDGTETPASVSSRIGTGYHDYVEEIHPYIQDIIKSDSSYPYVRVIDGRIFIIRNLYTTMDYQRYGTLVLELNRAKVFQDMSADTQQNMVVCINDGNAALDFTSEEEDSSGRTELMKQLKAEYDGTSNRKTSRVENGTYIGYLYQERHDNYHIGIMLFVERSELYSSLYELYAIVGMMLFLLIPIIGYCIYFLRRQIQMPLKRILYASKKMEEGAIGTTVGGEPMPNSEFQQMMESFDSMSLQVKYLFDYAYDEKLARKDAQIQALQAQINPHFLNNTLEMMNWQARMSGDAVVSKMIESLGTVLDYRMNRANVKEIHLAEELQCTDAYFYIMSMRFGQRLQIEKEIDDELLYIMVPPLILQPIVENAIVHGIEIMKNGIISLTIFHDEANVYLQVRNSGKKMTEEDRQRIQGILSGDESKIPKHQGKHTSIGIRNVNRRIRLVYGEEYGLSIEQDENNITISTITIPYRPGNEGSSLKERSEVENEIKNMARLNK